MWQSARIKLTGWYLVILMSISLTFSAVIYKALIMEVNRFERAQRFRFQRGWEELIIPGEIGQHPMPLIIGLELVEETKKRIMVTLAIINGVILVGAGGVGYFLAGRTLQPIKEMVDEQNRFVSDASHELRTPLTSLKSAFEVYLRNKKPTLSEAKTVIDESVTEVNKMQTLAESMLQLAQFQKPQDKMHMEEISVDEIVNEAIKKMELKGKEKNVRLTPTLSQATVAGNREALTQVLVILLDNAIKYSPESTEVTIKSTRRDGQVGIEVRDKGIGIQDADLPHIWDRFYRADTARSRNKDEGYGLGLAIAKKIIEIHKGRIDVRSKIGVGSAFTILLPIVKRKKGSASLQV